MKSSYYFKIKTLIPPGLAGTKNFMTPLKFSLKTEIIPLLILVAAGILGFYFYPRMPHAVVSHWNFAGQPDGYSGPFFGSFGIPLILLGIYLVFTLIPFLDPKKENYGDFAKAYVIFKSSMLLAMFIIFAATGFYNLGYAVKINYIAPITIGLLMMVLGNFMGKIQPNWFMGIRTPWTMSSERVWQKTHRLGGFLFVIFGLVIMVAPFLGKIWGLALFICGILLVTFGSMFYSYWLYREEKLLTQNGSNMVK